MIVFKTFFLVIFFVISQDIFLQRWTFPFLRMQWKTSGFKNIVHTFVFKQGNALFRFYQKLFGKIRSTIRGPFGSLESFSFKNINSCEFKRIRCWKTLDFKHLVWLKRLLLKYINFFNTGFRCISCNAG